MQIQTNDTDLIEFYYKANWKEAIPLPPEGRWADIQNTNHLKATHTISILEEYCRNYFGSSYLISLQSEKKFGF